MASAKTTRDEVASAVSAALATARKYKPETGLEVEHYTLVVALLTDASSRLGLLPDLLDTAMKADNVRVAELALDAAKAAQQG